MEGSPPNTFCRDTNTNIAFFFTDEINPLALQDQSAAYG